jgi:hypothetical protein
MRWYRQSPNLIALAELLGHASTKTTEIYLKHVKLDELAAVVNLDVTNGDDENNHIGVGATRAAGAAFGEFRHDGASRRIIKSINIARRFLLRARQVYCAQHWGFITRTCLFR